MAVILIGGLFVVPPTLLQKNVATEEFAADQPLEVVTLQLKWQHQFQFAGYYAAKAQGFYEEAGLDVRIVESTQGDESVQKVLGGEADFGIAMSDLVVLRSQGKPVVALATIYQHSPLVLLMPGDNGVDSIHDLVGKRVMLEAHSAELIAYLQSEGIAQSDFVTFPHNYDTQSLVRGEVDVISAYSTDEPFELRQQGISYSVFSPRSAGIDFYGDTLFTSEAQLADNPERTRRFVEASLKGWDYALGHPNEIIDLILTDYSRRHSRAHLAFEADVSRRLILADVIEIGYMNPGRWQHVAQVYASLGMVPPDLSLEGFLYDRNPKPDLTWVYASLAGLLALLLAAGFVSARFARLNTALRKQNEKRQLAETQLQEQERQMSTLLRNLPGMAYRCYIQPDWPMIFVSQGSVALTGYTPEDLISRQTVEYGDLIHPEDRVMVQEAVAAAVSEYRPFRIEYRILMPTGQVKWVWEQGMAIYAAAGEAELLEGFIADINEQRVAQEERESLIRELQGALVEVKTLQGILPICANCKKIRDDDGYWHQVEVYIHDHSAADFSHGICPDCMQREYPDIYARMMAHRQIILAFLAQNGPATQTQIMAWTDLSVSRISNLVAGMLEDREIRSATVDEQIYYHAIQA